jgi:predicted transcriptional regulator
MDNRKSPAGDETIASASTYTPFWKRRTPEEWRQRILENLEKLPHVDLTRVDWFVRSILHDDPLLMSLATAPEDDEPECETDQAAIDEAEEDIRLGRVIPHEQVMKEIRSDS